MSDDERDSVLHHPLLETLTIVRFPLSGSSLKWRIYLGTGQHHKNIAGDE